jgi:acetolactate synthase-1/2/3 large subunit
MTTMAIEQMLSEEMPASVLVGRVLEEAGIEMVFGISGGTGRIVSGLSKYQNSILTVLVREESLGGVMAEIYGRLTRRPGVLLGQCPWVLGNGLLGTIEATISAICRRWSLIRLASLLYQTRMALRLGFVALSTRLPSASIG